jgi:hypothetical protein
MQYFYFFSYGQEAYENTRVVETPPDKMHGLNNLDYDEAKAEAQPLWHQFISNAVGTLMSTAVLYFPVNALVLDKVRRECYIDFIHRGAHIAGGGNGDLGPLQLSGQ